MDQTRHDAPPVYHGADHPDIVAEIRAQADGLPRLFAVHRMAEGAPPGRTVAWGIEFPDRSAVTIQTAESFSSWDGTVPAATLLDGELGYLSPSDI